jgi:ribosome-associated toxin RatA of RatAB toxin-antitoxin module
MKRSLSLILVLAFSLTSNLTAQAKSTKHSTTAGVTKSVSNSKNAAHAKTIGFAGLENKMETGMVTAEEVVDGKTFHIGKTIVNASPEQVFDVLTDYANATKLFDNLKKTSVVASSSDENTTDVSFSLKGLANIWNFDYVLRMKETFPSRIDFHRLSGAFKANEGYWKIEPLDASGKRTLVTYSKYVDGGMIPQSMVNKQVKEAMPTVMANVKAHAEAKAVQVSLK